MASIRLVGANELQKVLADLPKRLANKILRSALRKAARVIEAEAERRAPKDTGELTRSIVTRMAKRRKRGSMAMVVFPDPRKFKDDAHAYYQEYGTARHEARPFMRPALDAKKGEAEKIIRAEVAKEIAATRVKRS